MLPDLPEFQRNLESVLGERNHGRPLDSLDMAIVMSYLMSRGVQVDFDEAAANQTIGEWLRWAEQRSKPG